MWIRMHLLAALCGLVVVVSGVANALPQGTLASVVSVIPEWPGQPQGGRGAPPGTAPEGSGIAIAPGIVATAWHVVEPADSIEVRLSDGRIVSAELIAADPATDIAVLAVSTNLPEITPAGSYELADRVCAAGNAFGLGLSVTCGVISATGISSAGFNPVEDFVQTDAAINPGMSGGGLFDGQGRLVGMVSAIFGSGTDGNIGVNFAVSAALLKRVTDALLADGEVQFPRPGWQLGIADERTRARIAAPVVLNMSQAGPAAMAGIEVGDLVLEVSGRQVRTARDVIAALALIPQDAPDYTVRVERGGETQTLRVPFEDPQTAATQDAAETPGDCPHPANVCRMRQAIFPISSFDPLGSATRIGPELVVTNRHVVGDRADALVHTPDGPRNAQVVPSAYRGDLVLLKVPGLPEGGYIPQVEAKDTEAETYYVVGADINREEVRVFDPGGLIAEPAEDAELGRLHVYARMQPGVSGGALVDETGTLMGIAVGGGDRRFEAIPAVDVLRLLDLRDAPSAKTVTSRLGAAFADCEEDLSQARNDVLDASVLADITEACGSAENQGQLLEAGRILARAGDFDAAAMLHGAAVAQVPNSINARMSLLVSLQLGARFEEMKDHARRLLDMAPDDPQALRFAIQSGVWGGDPELAEAGYQALLDADPVQAQAARRFIDSAPPAPPRR